jgi:Ser/Thr protein kinase RdoA (MazF antagonist)
MDVETAVSAGIRARLGLRDLQRLGGGHQSSVYLADSNGEPVVLKLVEALGVDRETLRARLRMLSILSRRTDAVCAPVPIRDDIVHELERDDGGRCYAVCYQFAVGEQPDVTTAGDAALMGRELENLHRHLAALPPFHLPVIAGFRRHSDGAPGGGYGPQQLLHGDFNSANIRVAAGRSRIFDFDDCGYGPIEFDLAQALYFVLFDAVTRQEPTRYEVFRTNFLAGYGERIGIAQSDTVLNFLIAQRVRTLGSWLADLSQAPPGIRNSSAEWLATLRGFVDGYLQDC